MRIIAGRDTESEEVYYDEVIDPNRLANTVVRDAVPRKIVVRSEAYQGSPNLRSAKELFGYGIQARDGVAGHVEDFIINNDDWTIQMVAIDTRNWLPGNKVLLTPSWIEIVRWSEAKVHVNLNRETIADAPAYDPTILVSQAHETK